MLLCHQDSYYWSDRILSHQNHIQYFHVIPSKNLCFGFMQENLTNWNINNIIIILLSVKFIYWYVIVPVVLSRPNFSILRIKVSQDLAFIWWIPRGHVWDMWVWYYPTSILHISYHDCQCYHSSQSKYLTERLLLYLSCCDQHGWNLP